MKRNLWEAAGLPDPEVVQAERERAAREAEAERRARDEEERRVAALTPETVREAAVAACLSSLRAARVATGQHVAAYRWRGLVREAAGADAVKRLDRHAPMGVGYSTVWWWRQAVSHGAATLDDLQRVAGDR